MKPKSQDKMIIAIREIIGAVRGLNEALKPHSRDVEIFYRLDSAEGYIRQIERDEINP